MTASNTCFTEFATWYNNCVDYYGVPTFLRLGRELGIGEAYSLKEFIRLSIGKATGVYLHPTVMDGITLSLSVIYERLVNNYYYKPYDLMNELENSGVKYTKDEVVMVTKNSDGMLMWLEKGNEYKGLIYIEGHVGQLIDKGLIESKNQIIDAIKLILQTKPLDVIPDERGLTALYEYMGSYYKIAYGTNGLIVSLFPYTPKK